MGYEQIIQIIAGSGIGALAALGMFIIYREEKKQHIISLENLINRYAKGLDKIVATLHIHSESIRELRDAQAFENQIEIIREEIRGIDRATG